MKLLTPRQEKLIINNVVKAVSDINKLNNTGYKYLHLCSGFIAHYDRYGFIAAFNPILRGFNLRRELINNHKANMWLNFCPRDRDYDYYKQKARIYDAIVKQIL